MSDSASPSRVLRVQFSLRGLLLFMLIVSGAVVAYRWPWIEETETGGLRSSQLTTRYHRGWNGEPVKHGLQIEEEPGGMIFERSFDEGELRFVRRRFLEREVEETHIRDGKPHGKYSSQIEDVETFGEYRNGRKHGEWKLTSSIRVVREHWQDGRRHGEFAWTTPEGRELQTAAFEKGRLVRWNGLPLSDAIRSWVAAEVRDESQRLMLLSPISSGKESTGLPTGYDEYVHVVGAERLPLSVYCNRRFPLSEHSDGNQPVVEIQLAQALENSYTIAWRFNMLHLVPITAESLAWRDRTGVYDVKFAAGSPQEKHWLRLAGANPFFRDRPALLFRGILEARDSPVIEIDTSVFPGSQHLFEGGELPNGMPRTRRDQFGQHLNLQGCYVVQDGNKLIVKRLPVEPPARPVAE
jgi:hypothetical protein